MDDKCLKSALDIDYVSQADRNVAIMVSCIDRNMKILYNGDMIKRIYQDKLESMTVLGKVLVLYGPRRGGKTTLIETYLSTTYKGHVYKSTGENIQLREVLESSDFSRIVPYFSSYDLVFIDEAQKIENIGNGLKILVDQLPNTKVIATGSSSFDLSNKVGEPLVGRQFTYKLFPVSVDEISSTFGRAYVEENLNNLLVYGSYPEVLNAASFEEKRRYLVQIRDSYLFKDILELEGLKNSRKISDLLRLVAYQVGKEVSLTELAGALEISKNTVARYLDLLEKSFVLINLRGFSRNLRSEVTKSSKYYFYDNGVRNAVIDNFGFVGNREDIGALWENFLVVERLKKQTYDAIYTNNYFWRTWDKKEIDWVEDRGGNLYGYEFKYSKDQVSEPKKWKETYPGAEYKVVNKTNYFEFVG